MTSIKEGDKAQKAQISDLNSLITDMKEQKNKDIKQVNDEKKWAALQKRIDGGVEKEVKGDDIIKLPNGSLTTVYHHLNVKDDVKESVNKSMEKVGTEI